MTAPLPPWPTEYMKWVRYEPRDAMAVAALPRLRLAVAELKRISQWDQMQSPFTPDHGYFAKSIDRVLEQIGEIPK